MEAGANSSITILSSFEGWLVTCEDCRWKSDGRKRIEAMEYGENGYENL